MYREGELYVFGPEWCYLTVHSGGDIHNVVFGMKRGDKISLWVHELKDITASVLLMMVTS